VVVSVGAQRRALGRVAAVHARRRDPVGGFQNRF
jgi:hypothetical protein